MRPSRALALLALAILLTSACTSGTTEVQGLPDTTGPTGVTSPTGSTGPTAVAGDAFSLDFTVPSEITGQVSDFGFFTCNGLEGTWRYVFKADFGQGIVFDVDAETDMSGGDGTLVFGGQFDLPGLGSVSWTDTVDLRLIGSRAIEATNVKVDVESNIPGFTDDLFRTLPENDPIPIVEGSDRC